MDRRQRTRFFDLALDRRIPLAGTLAVLVAVLEATVDWITWVELDVSAVYGVPLVLAAVARNRRLLWALAAGLVCVTFAAYAVQIGAGGFSIDEPYFINRVLSAGALILSAGLCHVWIVAANRLAAQRQSLIDQNDELDSLRRTAEEASGRKTQLLAAVSHDIRTPLAAIDMIANIIQHSADNPVVISQLPDLAKRLQRNTRSLSDFASALVDISSLDAGGVSVSKTEFSLNELLLGERERLLLLAQAKGLQLSVEAPSPPLRLLTDRVKLIRVLSNLVTNAIKFTTNGGVTVSAKLGSEGQVLICVADTGVGMKAADLAKIFDEYGQLGNSRRNAD
ncbi:MAG TPA: HAMP domain-containing sensor histidine kinase, partial [Burkholderiales bacterium]|nr:HAMP domain-containing sensor histidine kinase [Burkholderiales bacterium]